MRRAALALSVLGLALAGCGDGDVKDARKKIDQATEDARKGGKKAVDQAEKALKDLEDSDLPEDVQKELREAKDLVDGQK